MFFRGLLGKGDVVFLRSFVARILFLRLGGVPYGWVVPSAISPAILFSSDRFAFGLSIFVIVFFPVVIEYGSDILS